jgi:hypothetical protein
VAPATAAAAVLVLLVLLVLARLLLGIGEHALERFLGAPVELFVADVRVNLAFSHLASLAA